MPQDAEPGSPTSAVLALCRQEGFALAGIAPAQPSAWREELEAWLAAGKHGEMSFLERDGALRADPRLFSVAVEPGDTRARRPGDAGVLPVRSFVIVADLYSTRSTPPDPQLPARSGRIARYARGRDYHAVVRSRLHALSDRLRAAFPGQGFMAFVDTTPIMEREVALLAGLGWIGKHTLLINPRLGSRFLLGGIGTSLPLESPGASEPDRCGTCTRCIDACPTGALTPYSLDARRCVSYLTIEHRTRIDPALHAGMGGWIFGCDACQDACPHNSPRADGAEVGEPHPELAPRRHALDALDVLAWDEGARRRALAGSAMRRVALPMFKRNALIVLGNELRERRDAAIESRLRDIAWCAREPTLVRETARDVLRSLS